MNMDRISGQYTFSAIFRINFKTIYVGTLVCCLLTKNQESILKQCGMFFITVKREIYKNILALEFYILYHLNPSTTQLI